MADFIGMNTVAGQPAQGGGNAVNIPPTPGSSTGKNDTQVQIGPANMPQAVNQVNQPTSVPVAPVPTVVPVSTVPASTPIQTTNPQPNISKAVLAQRAPTFPTVPHSTSTAIPTTSGTQQSPIGQGSSPRTDDSMSPFSQGQQQTQQATVSPQQQPISPRPAAPQAPPTSPMAQPTSAAPSTPNPLPQPQDPPFTKTLLPDDLSSAWRRTKCENCGYVYEGTKTMTVCPRCNNNDPDKFEESD